MRTRYLVFGEMRRRLVVHVVFGNQLFRLKLDAIELTSSGGVSFLCFFCFVVLRCQVEFELKKRTLWIRVVRFPLVVYF